MSFKFEHRTEIVDGIVDKDQITVTRYGSGGALLQLMFIPVVDVKEVITNLTNYLPEKIERVKQIKEELDNAPFDEDDNSADV